ncbi:group 3 allergen SMIPP-S [Sarcoptes scabiei]|nr:group 3 allergen SMIPP-S [Sarcoptes scabiei]
MDSYKPETKENNIALLETSEMLLLDGKKSSTIDLPVKGFDPTAGSSIYVSGYGDAQLDETSSQLNAANLTVVDKTDCQTRYGQTILDARVFCAEASDVTFEKGDAGDPAVQNRRIVGMYSYQQTKISGRPDLFTRIGDYVDWIKTIIKE